MKYKTGLEQALKLVKDYEGFKPVPYKDPTGLWTCGCGCRFWDNQLVRYDYPKQVTRQEAEDRAADVLEHLDRGFAHFEAYRKLKPGQHAALLDLAFNVGVGHVLHSILWHKVCENRPYEEVAKEFLNWVHMTVDHKVVTSNWLVQRRNAELALWKEGAK